MLLQRCGKRHTRTPIEAEKLNMAFGLSSKLHKGWATPCCAHEMLVARSPYKWEHHLGCCDCAWSYVLIVLRSFVLGQCLSTL